MEYMKKDIKIIKEEYQLNKLIPLDKINLNNSETLSYLLNNFNNEDIYFAIKFYENEKSFDFLKYFPQEFQNKFIINELNNFMHENKYFPISLNDFRQNFSLSIYKKINNYQDVKEFYDNYFSLSNLKKYYPYLKSKEQFLIEQISINYKKTGRNIAAFFGSEIEDKYFLFKINNFLKENKRYPIYIDEFKSPINDLPTSYRGTSINSFNEIKNIYKNILNINDIEVDKFIIKENIKLFHILNYKKFFKFDQISDNNDNIYRKIHLFLLEYYKSQKNEYPKYKDIKKTSFFPFILGMNDISSIEYNSLFQDNEIMKYFSSINEKEEFFSSIKNEISLLSEFYEGLDDKIVFDDEDKEENIKKNKVSTEVEKFVFIIVNSIFESIKNQHLKPIDILNMFEDKSKFQENFEQIISLFSNSFIQEINEKDFDTIYTDIKKDIKILLIDNKQEIELSGSLMKEMKIKTNLDIITKDVLNIMQIVLNEYDNSSYKDFYSYIQDSQFIDLNEEVQKNMKGYDYLFVTPEKKDIFLSYKYKNGRSFANLSISKLFGNDLIDTTSLEFKELKNLLISIDEEINKTKILENIFLEKLEFIFQYLNSNKLNFKNDNINDIFYKLFNVDKILNDKNIENCHINNTIIEIFNSKTEMLDFNENINKLILYDVFKIIHKNNYNLDQFIDKKDEIVSKLINKLSSKPFLEHSLLSIENNKLKTEYKYIIKSIYRNEEIIKFVSNQLELQKDFDLIVYEHYMNLYKKPLENFMLNTKDEELKEFLNILLHFENLSIESQNYVIGNAIKTKLLSIENIEELLPLISLEVKNFEPKKWGVSFDFTLFLNKEPLIELKKNIIKSKQGKLMYGHLIDFATSANFTFHNELIKKLEAERKLKEIDCSI